MGVARLGHILGFVDDTHRAGAEFLDDTIVRDGLPDHRRECYFCETGKSMKAWRLPLLQEDRWRNMYGPPPNCNKNRGRREQSAKMYPAS